MDVILIAVIPILFLILATVMMVVSEVSGFFTFTRMSARQRVANQLIASFIAKMRLAQVQLARRSKQLQALSGNLKASNEELERLNNMKSRFLSMVAHDMRTPLASIQGFAGMLGEQKKLGQKEKRYVENITVAADQIGRLTGDLTDLAMIEAGKLKMEMAPFDLVALANELIPSYSLIGQKKSVDVILRVPDYFEVTGDRFRIGQVLANLLGNAVKFTPPGGRVELSVVPSSTGALCVVSDTGPGIHPSEKERVFEKFYQSSHGTAAAKRQGWGLGLSIAQEVVRAHAGEIGVESPGLGRGSKFWVFVPVAPGSRLPGLMTRRALLALTSFLAAFILPLPAAAQSLPLEDKAKFDRFLEEKAEGVLLKILGPNRSKVVVDATVDFTRTEKFQVLTGKSEGKGEGGVGAPPIFAWQSLEATSTGMSEFLPGVPVQKDEKAQGTPQSYERSTGYAPSFVKRLAVTLILDRSVPVEQADNIQTIVSDLLEIDPNRGDALTMVRAAFAPPWKTIWYSQDSFSMVFRYSLLALMTLITLTVVAFCFIRLANAMDQMAKAQQNYGMDLSGQTGMGEGEEEEDKDLLEGPEEEKKDEPAEGEIIIEVKEEQLDTLVTMIAGEDPDNIALVLTHLTTERRKQFLAKLPRDVEAEVLVRLSEVRFVEPGVVEGIKDELERRLASAVGGINRVFEIIDAADPAGKRDILAALERSNPELAKVVRAKVLLMEDLMRMGPQDWALLMGRIRIEDWAAALKDAAMELRLMLRSQMMPKTWAILEQTMAASAASPDRVAQAQSTILGEVWKMVQSGQIQNPLENNAPGLPDLSATAAPAAAGAKA